MTTLTAEQARAARATLKRSIRQVAEAARISMNTLARIERGEPVIPATMEAVFRLYAREGLEFTDDGVRRRRAVA